MREKCKGTGAVFSFTVTQALKGKAQMVMTIINAVIILASMPVMDLMNKSKESENLVESMYVVNETSYDVSDFSGLAQTNEKFAKTTFVAEKRSAAEVTSQLENDKDANSLLVVISQNEGLFTLRYVVTENGLSESDIDLFSEDIEQYFSKIKLKALGISEDKLAFMNAPVDTNVTQLSSTGETVKDTEAISMSEYNIILASIVLMILCIAMSGEMVSQSVVAEKTTRLVETLLTSVKPVALIFGKVLGSLAVVFMQILLYILCAGGSALLSMLINDRSTIQLPSQIQRVMNELSVTSISPLSIVLALLSILGGITIFGLIAGLFGAMITRMDELAEGMKAYTFTMIIGAYAAIAIAIAKMSGTNVAMWETIACVFPITSPFLLPMKLLLGRTPIWLAITSLLVMYLFIVLIGIFVAKVYHIVLLHSGNRLKLKDLFRITKKEATVNGK